MTIEEIMVYDANILARLSDKDLRAIAAGGRKIANQRLQRLKTANITDSPALKSLPAAVRQSGFATRGKNRAALIATIQQEQAFIRARTSTKKGWEELKRKVADKANQSVQGAKRKGKARYGYDETGNLVLLKRGQKSAMTVRQVNLFWDLFDKVREDPHRSGSLASTQVYEVLYNLIKQHPRSGLNSLEQKLPVDMKVAYLDIQKQKEKEVEDIMSGGGTTF